jgi:crotonobetainyl-CoA:carnitine CoA-transferase CaiB-like acyl-CoA transferase
MLLADLGADVVKIESALGDLTRQVPPFLRESSAFFVSLNRNKRSAGIDLRKPAGADLFLDLVRECDVVLEGFRPGRADRLGIGPSACLTRNPRLIYCSISGYGQTGPDRGRAGHYLTYLARAGFLDLNRRPGEPPVLPPVQIADLAAGGNAATAVCAALFARERTGAGRALDVSMLDSALAWMGSHLASRQAGLEPEPGALLLGGRFPFYNVYRAADGAFVALAAIEPLFWHEFCRAVGRPDLASQQFADGDARFWMFAELEVIFAQRTGEEWSALIRDRDLSAEVVRTVGAMLEDTHLVEREAVRWLECPGEGPVVQVAPPVRVVGEPLPGMRPPPVLAGDTRAVLSELLGLDPNRIDQLFAEKAAFGPEAASNRRLAPAALH